MIRLSNGHQFEYMVASGALGFDGIGWPWERPLVWTGLIRPELFTVVLKTLTFEPREGNLRWYKPWECVKLIPGGSVNKVGLTNPGIKYWMREIGPKLNYKKYPLVISIWGTETELLDMIYMINHSGFDFMGIELNVSCPNTGEKSQTEMIVDAANTASGITSFPLILKLGADQEYLKIAKQVVGNVQAISLNSVPWEKVYPKIQTPLWRLEQRVGQGGGGVSGIPAQEFNWSAVAALKSQGLIPVIAPSAMSHQDVLDLFFKYHADAVSFGAIHLRKPWLPTKIVLEEIAETSSLYHGPKER